MKWLFSTKIQTFSYNIITLYYNIITLNRVIRIKKKHEKLFVPNLVYNVERVFRYVLLIF